MKSLLTMLMFLLASNASAETRTRDGLHFVVGIGATFLSASLAKHGNLGFTISGFGADGMLQLGYTIAPAVTVGVCVAGSYIPSGAFRFYPLPAGIPIGRLRTKSDSPLVSTLIGPYLDWAPDPFGGLRVLVIAGFATLFDGLDTHDVGKGVGGSIGLGWDWPVAGEWTVGVLARVEVLSTSVERSIGPFSTDFDYLTLAPGLVVSATYH